MHFGDETGKAPVFGEDTGVHLESHSMGVAEGTELRPPDSQLYHLSIEVLGAIY